MITYERVIHLEEVDTAQIVFFARYFSYAHEAMEHLFSGLAGGYPGLVNDRHTCFTTVRLEADFQAPLRYGDRLNIHTELARLGTRSATVRYELVRADGISSAKIVHTIVCTDMRALSSCDVPDDVRALLTRHVARPSPSAT